LITEPSYAAYARSGTNWLCAPEAEPMGFIPGFGLVVHNSLLMGENLEEYLLLPSWKIYRKCLTREARQGQGQATRLLG